MDFHFAFKRASLGALQVPREIEYWLPLEENASLEAFEKKLLMTSDELIESLYIVIPSVLIEVNSHQMGYYPCHELDYYLLAAKLKKSPQMVLLQENKKSAHMHQHLMKTCSPEKKSCFYLDHHFAPNFGGALPKYALFERKEITEIPNTAILFREV